MGSKDERKPDEVEVSLNLGVVQLKGIWKPKEPEKCASWDLYVELITRISVMELPPGEGLLREGLSSLHAIFGKTREILHDYGPEVARVSEDDDDYSFGYLSILILNYVLRPLLTTWHPRLLDWEDQRDESVSRVEHEKSWEYNDELRQELNKIRMYLIEYADLLAKVADVPQLVLEPNISKENAIPKTTLRDEKLTYYGNSGTE